MLNLIKSVHYTQRFSDRLKAFSDWWIICDGLLHCESGVAAFTFVNAALKDQPLRQQLRLTTSSRVLVINTGGDTDEQVYRDIINH
jgi:hypothetical protein